MQKSQDIRWEQRFSNFNKALIKLDQAVKYIKSNFYEDGKFDESLFDQGEDIIKEGLIQRFEYTHELAWNIMKDFLIDRGSSEIFGSKDAIREAFNTGLINDGKIWMEMIKSKNKTSHTYNEDTAQEIFLRILEDYYPVFLSFQQSMEGRLGNSQTNMSDK